MALEDLTFDELVRVLVEDLCDTSRRVCSVGYLTRLVHGDERVPARVKDPDVLAALTVAVEKGWVAYENRNGIRPSLPSTDGTPFVRVTQAGLDLVYKTPGRTRAEALDFAPRYRTGCTKDPR